MRCASRVVHAVSVGMLLGLVVCGQEPEKSTAPFWDKVYSQNSGIFSHRPTELLKWAVKDRTPGKALDIGMGQGRNSIFLAQQGWDVTGFDPSAEGIRRAKAAAQELRLRLHALVAREENFDLGRDKWDLIVMTYIRLVNREDAARFQGALRPGGIFVYENNNVGVPNELLRAFLGFRILRFEDVDAYTDWHPEKKQRVERLIVERTAK
ncbi:MAG TPA: class I SAM-dependent methyltransferase [Bryobacteraceae bacterium]|nr:class I SAM-dependent methyltransferase [Bryobacteraceae bacterium]